ncbi:hypothetical protein ACJMK2_019163 [Sinanodonta woodiana]|uniref:Uncharacterized protein n=1 Tax=Sinanodonta woodiana TaxID=1069815 RepID=A0ABD3UH44_SINWO
MSSGLFMLAVLLSIHCAKAQEDCHRTAANYEFTSSHQCSYTISYYGVSSLTGFNCGPDYQCCDNACCKRSSETIPSDMETVGVVLSATATFAIIILALLIFGATFCNNKDEVELLNKRRHRVSVKATLKK